MALRSPSGNRLSSASITAQRRQKWFGTTDKRVAAGAILTTAALSLNPAGAARTAAAGFSKLPVTAKVVTAAAGLVSAGYAAKDPTIITKASAVPSKLVTAGYDLAVTKEKYENLSSKVPEPQSPLASYEKPNVIKETKDKFTSYAQPALDYAKEHKGVTAAVLLGTAIVGGKAIYTYALGNKILSSSNPNMEEVAKDLQKDQEKHMADIQKAIDKEQAADTKQLQSGVTINNYASTPMTSATTGNALTPTTSTYAQPSPVTPQTQTLTTTTKRRKRTVKTLIQPRQSVRVNIINNSRLGGSYIKKYAHVN